MESKRILVIDDKPQVCGLLKRVLEKAGYEVETVGNPSETVASILVQRYDLVTVDLKMPGMDGTDVATLAQTIDDTLPILVISAFLNPEVRRQFEQSGVHHFVEKPFQKSNLLATVETTLQEAEPHTA